MITPAIAERIEPWLISRLKPNKRNPRLHSDAQIAAIAACIRQYGFNAPVGADNPGHRPRIVDRLLPHFTDPIAEWGRV